MLLKEEKGRINFIDDKDNFVGFDYETSCCECFGYYISHELTGVPQGQVEPSLEGFRFDTTFPPVDVESSNEEEAIVAFKCVNDVENVLYLHLSNTHNGYYSHGWDTSWGHEGSI